MWARLGPTLKARPYWKLTCLNPLFWCVWKLHSFTSSQCRFWRQYRPIKSNKMIKWHRKWRFWEFRAPKAMRIRIHLNLHSFYQMVRSTILCCCVFDFLLLRWKHVLDPKTGIHDATIRFLRSKSVLTFIWKSGYLQSRASLWKLLK